MRIALTLAASLAATAAFAQTTVIQRDAPAATIIQRDAPATTVIERRSDPVVIERRSVGCDTTTVKRTDGLGDTTVRKTTDC